MDTETKRLLKEGFYWEALKLPQGSPYPSIVKRIAEIEQSCHGDNEAKVLLAQARRFLMGNRYPPARSRCEELFSELGEYSNGVSQNDIVVRSYVWQHDFVEDASNTPGSKERLANTLRDGAVKLHDGTGENIYTERVRRKALRCLDIAIQYTSNNIKDNSINKSLKAAFLFTDSIKCINQAQENLKREIEREMSTTPPSIRTMTNSINRAINDIRNAISDLEEAKKLDSGNQNIQTQIGIANDILQAITKQKEQTGEASKSNEARVFCNKGIERINQAQNNFKSGMENSNARPQLVVQTILDIKAGIADIEKAVSLEPNNKHFKEQLATARQILQNLENIIPGMSSILKNGELPSFLQELGRPSYSTGYRPYSGINLKPTSKKKGVAVSLAIFLGWLGIDRFYLGYVSWGLAKLGLFIFSMVMIFQGGSGWPLIASLIWWLIDIILIAGGWLKDSYGIPLG